jgi:predicted dinucleotide-binding enzyme
VQIAILGTGRVATLLADRWAAAGHTIVLGSRDPASYDGPHRAASTAEAVAAGEVVVNALPGSASVGTLSAVDADTWAGKVLLDAANAVAPGFQLAYPNASLGEKLHEALPGARVVKSLNTAGMEVLVDPGVLEPASVFLSGEDDAAKQTVAGLLRDLGWADDGIVDLGGIGTARGTEHYFLLFVALMQARGRQFNIRVVGPRG